MSVGPQTAHLALPLDAPFLGTTTGSASTARLLANLDAAERIAGGLYEESQRERTALVSSLRRSELAGGSSGAPIAVAVDIRAAVEHNFDQGCVLPPPVDRVHADDSVCSPLILPIKLLLRNESPFASFDYTLQLLSGQKCVSSLLQSRVEAVIDCVPSYAALRSPVLSFTRAALRLCSAKRFVRSCGSLKKASCRRVPTGCRYGPSATLPCGGRCKGRRGRSGCGTRDELVSLARRSKGSNRFL